MKAGTRTKNQDNKQNKQAAMNSTTRLTISTPNNISSRGNHDLYSTKSSNSINSMRLPHHPNARNDPTNILLSPSPMTCSSHHKENTSMTAPNRLPPKSPASISGRMLPTVGSNASSSSGRSRRSSSSRRRRRERSKSRNRRDSSFSINESSSTDTDSSDLLPKATYIKDPSPDHLTVYTNTDDLSNAEHFSLISFEKSMRDNPNLSIFPEYDLIETSNNNRNNNNDGKNRRRHRRSHRRIHSWNSSSSGDLNTMDAASNISLKSCLAVPKVLRRQRVMAADVASVGNASDTLVSIIETNNGNGRGRITGRELHETAKAAMNEGNYVDALHMFEAILSAQLERFGSEVHSSVGAALHNVGVVRLRIGEPLKAEEAFMRALAIRRNVLEAGHLDLAATLAKLGSTRTALCKFDDGLRNLREALKITRLLLGRNHRTVAQILCHIACLYFEAGEFYSAQSTFEDALDIYRGAFQVDADRDGCMAQMTETICNIGSIQNKRKNFSGAIESFREALDLQRGIMGHDHPKVLASLDNLAYSFSKSKLYNQALICYKEMLTAQMFHLGSFTLECYDTLAKQVLIYRKLKKIDDAVLVVTKHVESVQARSEHEISLENDEVAKQLNQMLNDLNSKKKRPSKSTKGGRRDRSLDCFDRILFDKRRAEF
mmetsp:Transcript_51044/g.55273  ORF Transcript_51044/g.55273 Transcript_51044/m.55273 type:complete len:660 (-) Transcript_51044:2578-4557(-)